MRHTKIVCTLGPSSANPDMVTALARGGMNVARINFSHGSQESQRAVIKMVKETAEKNDLALALLLDTKGPEIRTGDVEKPIDVKKNEEVVFAFGDKDAGGRTLIKVNYDLFAKDVKNAECILLDNGTMSFDLVSVEKDGTVIARSRDDGKIGSRRHVNLPGADVSLPSMTDKDWSDLELGIEENMDFIALSFIRTGAEVLEVKKFLEKKKSHMRIISKIETRQSVADIDNIIDASDGIMVARGDLGAELPFEQIPAVQDMIVAKCLAKAKPVIVATQMLESMIVNPMPTRAEVTDIAHAATTHADATMLSGETAAGQHPLLAIEAMHRTLVETESHLKPMAHDTPLSPFGDRSALADAAVSMALRMNLPAFVVITRSGATAQAVSALRPNLPIFAFADSPEVQRSMLLCHGIMPMIIDFDDDPETTVENAFKLMKEKKLLPAGRDVVVITDVRSREGRIHTVHVRKTQ